jgi:hypothetical protein
LDKGWHGLHFLFTSSAEGGEDTSSWLLAGGMLLDEEGQVRALRPNEVRAWADYLAGTTRDELDSRYDPARMAALDIYPAIWRAGEGGSDEARDWLLDCYESLKQFVSRAAAAGDGVLIHLA